MFWLLSTIITGSDTSITPQSTIQWHSGAQLAGTSRLALYPATLCNGRLHKALAGEPALRAFTGEAAPTAAEQEAMSRAFCSAFATVDTEILNASRDTWESDGSTCVALLCVGECST